MPNGNLKDVDIERRAAAAAMLFGTLLFSLPSAFPDDSVGQVAGPKDDRLSEIVAAGIEHVTIRRGDFTAAEGTDRWTIHVLLVDPSRTRMALAVAMDEIAGAETTSSIAVRRGAIAAVNGGYFRTAGTYRGETIGLLSVEGLILSEPNAGRTALAVSNAEKTIRIAVARTELSAELVVDTDAKHKIDGFNRPREKDELVIYLPEFHRTTLTTPDGLEAAVERGRVAAVRDGTGSTAIPPRGFVISAAGTAREWAVRHLKPGRRARVETALRADPLFPFEPEFVLGAGPHLLHRGEQLAGEKESFPDGFYGQRHPRTALGVKADGTIVLATVDGRQPKTSLGMSIPELAALMAALGCVEAINLDGGGSTTMAVRGRVVNSPSDPSGERPVSDALLVFLRLP
jgi:exopolysaccharide biosynthesis protein